MIINSKTASSNNGESVLTKSDALDYNNVSSASVTFRKVSNIVFVFGYIEPSDSTTSLGIALPVSFSAKDTTKHSIPLSAYRIHNTDIRGGAIMAANSAFFTVNLEAETAFAEKAWFSGFYFAAE